MIVRFKPLSCCSFEDFKRLKLCLCFFCFYFSKLQQKYVDMPVRQKECCAAVTQSHATVCRRIPMARYPAYGAATTVPQNAVIVHEKVHTNIPRRVRRLASGSIHGAAWHQAEEEELTIAAALSPSSLHPKPAHTHQPRAWYCRASSSWHTTSAIQS